MTTEQNAAAESTPRERVASVMAKHGLTITSEFVPFSKSRNAKPQEDGKVWRSLNWKVTLHRRVYSESGIPLDRAILTTDYAAGEAHCPSYKHPPKFPGGDKVDPYAKEQCIAWECENGKRARWSGTYVMPGSIKEKLEPDPCDVLHSLVTDADVLDYGTFEEWADNYGYDADSRKAEATYRACLDIALKLRNGLGDAVIAELRDAMQDY